MACEVCGKSYVWNAEDENFDSDAKPHVCTTCGQSFSLKIQLKRHTLLHANGESYVCIHCSKTTAEKEKSKSYNLRKSDKYPCDVCGESFDSKRMLQRHSTKEHAYENADSDTDDDYGQPKKRKPRPYRKRTTSQKIELPKRTNSSAERVVQEEPNKRYVCPTCSKRFMYQTFLDRHTREGKCKNTKLPPNIGAKDKKHVCNVCGKSFARKSSLEGHELTHVKEGFASSPEEDANESSDDEFASAVDDDVKDRTSEPKKPRLSKIKIQKSYKCDHCNYVCFSKPTLEKHLANHKEKSEEEVKDRVATGKEDRDEGPKENQKEIHSCEICDKVFRTKGRLKRHLLFHVTRDKEERDRPPSSKWEWSSSGTKKRKRSKDYSCDVCGKQFAGLTCLRKHSLKHSESAGSGPSPRRKKGKKEKVVQPMECGFCEEVFTGKRSAYVRHLHSHTPEVCGICDERFVDRASLREHCRVHVGTEEGRMFMECSQKALDAKNGLLPPEPKVEYIYLVLR